MTRQDLEAQYNNRAAVPDHPAVMGGWRTSSEAARAAHPPVVLAYGAGERETMDLFEAAPDAPVAMFIHGGYWQALDKSWFSFIAPALSAHGVSLAVPSYDLCPAVRLSRIVDQVRAATDLLTRRSGRPPLVFGHSAGGHLSACLLSEGNVSAAVAISGVFELEPLVPTSLNVALGLDAAEARRLSPRHWAAPTGAVLDCVVGGAETEEFVRQSRDMAAAWAEASVQTRFDALPDLNHFTVLDPLRDPHSPLVRRIATLSGVLS